MFLCQSTELTAFAINNATSIVCALILTREQGRQIHNKFALWLQSKSEWLCRVEKLLTTLLYAQECRITQY